MRRLGHVLSGDLEQHCLGKEGREAEGQLEIVIIK